jgi:hypothetical protein
MNNVSHMKVEPLKDHDSAEFLMMWVLANTVGLLVGRWIGGQIIGILWPFPQLTPDTFITAMITNPVSRVIIVGITTGTLIGILEWLVFRLFGFRVNWKWVVSSALACAAFPTLGQIMFSFEAVSIVTILGGVTLGVAQWLILRRIVNRASWWILPTAVTSAFLFGSITPNPYDEPFILFAGMIVGGVTGVVLLHLLKHPLYQSEMSFHQAHGDR